MATYITTVRLREALPADFDKLDFEMAKVRFVPVGQMQTDELVPYAKYSLKTSLSLPKVIAAAYLIARSIGKNYSLTVTKSMELMAG